MLLNCTLKKMANMVDCMCISNLKIKTKSIERINEGVLLLSLTVVPHTFGLFIRKFLFPYFMDEEIGTQRV